MTTEDSFDDQLRRAPMLYREPCAGCARLEATEAFGGGYFCTFTLPADIAAWIPLLARGIHGDLTHADPWQHGGFRFFTKKQIDGPFAENVVTNKCGVRSEPAA